MGSNPPLTSPQLAFDTKNRPHVVGNYGNTASYALDYNVVQNLWVPTLLPYSIGSQNGSIRLAIASDGKGGVGTAYLGFHTGTQELVYASKPDDGVWAGSVVIPNFFNPVTPGLAYDYQGIPAISYVNLNGDLALAYDPVTAPEPASLTLLALGGLALIRRRR